MAVFLFVIMFWNIIGFLVFIWYERDGVKRPLIIFMILVLSTLLAVLPILITNVQISSRERQLSRLSGLEEWPVSNSMHFKIATETLMTQSPPAFNSHYTLPMLSLVLTMQVGWMMILLAPHAPEGFNYRSFILGGMVALKDESDTVPLSVISYQKGTFLTVAAAFMGSYIYLLYRLLERIANNDIFPVSFYHYVARTFIACLTAIVARHSLELVSTSKFDTTNSGLVILVGFAIGFTPDLVLVAITRKAFQMLRIRGYQRDPEPNAIPTNLSLVMIEGLSKDKIERLSEIGVDNAQVLALQNPFEIWPRLPFSFLIIMDWIAQAQLYVLVKERGFKLLREKCIMNIFDLRAGLRDSAFSKELCQSVGVPESEIPTLLKCIEGSISFIRLAEVREKMAEQAAIPREVTGSEVERALVTLTATRETFPGVMAGAVEGVGDARSTETKGG
jgi:hypothetical protein